MILATQYVTDAHQGIVDRIAEKKCRGAIFATHDEIAYVIGQKALRAVHQVPVLKPLSQRHAKTQARSPALRLPHQDFSRTEIAAGSRIARRPPGCKLTAPRQIKFKRRAEACIRALRVYQLLEVACIQISALRLPERAFIPVQSQP